MTSRILYEELKLANKPDLVEELDGICKAALGIWDEQYLRPFTAHGRAHIDQVERNLDSLSRPLQKFGTPLTPEEILVLLSACYLHDIGMQLDDKFARERHAQYAYNLILHSSATIAGSSRRVTLPITDDTSRTAIAKVARGHWTDFALQLPETDFIGYNKQGRVKLLGTLLAIADLLDLSPVRARYYRTVHRLYTLGPLSELHQSMHALVKGFEITAPDSKLPQDLQFNLFWRSDTDVVRRISDWIMHWMSSQWRRLHEVLYSESGGQIRWVEPWSHVSFDPPEGPIPKLSRAADSVLNLERAEQLRIDRETFAKAFENAIGSAGATLFILPSDSALDGRPMSEWCTARASVEGCLVGKVDVQPGTAMDVASSVATLLEQWGQHLPECDDETALSELGLLVCAENKRGMVSVIVTERYRNDLLADLLDKLLQRPSNAKALPCVCVLLTTGGEGPVRLPGVTIRKMLGAVLQNKDIGTHLQNSWGYSEEKSLETISRMTVLSIADKPGIVYTYIGAHCALG